MALFVVEREHFPARRIDVKHRFPIHRPDDAIRSRDRAESQVKREIRVEPVELSVASFPHQTDSACEKPAVGRALTIVKSVVRLVWLRIGDRGELAVFLVEKEQPVITRYDQPATLARDHGAHALADVP